MEQEAKCPICLECLTDPVVLDCGHSFCQGCITNYCESWEQLGDLECPVCKVKFQKGDFRRNWQLASIIEKMKLLPLSIGNKDFCLRHKEKLHLFCKEDEQLVCFVCERSPEHRGHTTLLLEEAAQQYKDKISDCVETLTTERERILVYIARAENESREMLQMTDLTRQTTLADFSKLHQLLTELENELLAQIEEMEKEIARKRDQHLARLSEELFSLESLIREMGEKSQQPASELLQDVQGTLARYEKKETFENPEALPSELKRRVIGYSHNPFIKSAMKQFKETLAWAFPQLEATVTLDPASASSHVVLSWDQEIIKWQCTTQDVSEDPEEHYGFVLGHEGFTAGCHFWEVLVGQEDGWAVGVARKPVRGRGTLSPEEGVWAMGRWNGQYKAFIEGMDPSLTLSREPYRIRVCLNCNVGQVAFFNVHTGALLYEFSGPSFFGKTFHPFFAVYGNGWLKLFWGFIGHT